MSVIGPFGEVAYGEGWNVTAPPYSVVDAREFRTELLAEEVDYSIIRLHWGTVGSDDVDRISLARSQYGHPLSPYEGSVLYNGPAVLFSMIDGGLTPGLWYYYSLFVRQASTGLWRLAGTAEALSIKNWGYHERMQSHLPSFYWTADAQAANGVVENGQLYRFLKGFAFEFDKLRSYAETNLHVRDLRQVSSRLLPSISAELGYEYHAALGVRRMRSLLNQMVELRKIKGTQTSLERFASSLFGAPVTVTKGVNKLLSVDQASFDTTGSQTTWVPTNGTLTRNTSTYRTAPASLRIAATATADAYIHNCAVADIKTLGQFVVPGGRYAFSAWVNDGGGAGRVVTPNIIWYDEDGVLVPDLSSGIDTVGPYGETTYGGADPGGPHGVYPSSAVLTTVTDNGTWQRVWTIKSAPLGARYARLEVKWGTPTAGEFHYIDDLQFEESTDPANPTDYESPRLVTFHVTGQRTNLITNPSFETNSTGWTATNATKTTVATAATSGTKSMQLTQTAAPFSASASVSVDELDYYTFSLDIASPDGEGEVSLVTEWFDAAAASIVTDFTTFSLPQGGFLRPSVSVVAPEGAVSVAVRVEVDGLANTNTVLIDSVLFEKSVRVLDYFDGSLAGGSFFWAGTAHASESYFISNRSAVEAIFSDEIPNWLPGTPWELTYVPA